MRDGEWGWETVEELSFEKERDGEKEREERVSVYDSTNTEVKKVYLSNTDTFLAPGKWYTDIQTNFKKPEIGEGNEPIFSSNLESQFLKF